MKEIVEDSVSETMVSAINQVGHSMGLSTIAEYVENEAIYKKLVNLGVDYGQGYGIGRPIPFEEMFHALLHMETDVSGSTAG